MTKENKNITITMKEVGAYIRQLRQDKKWTIEKLADEAKLSPRTVYNIEHGFHVPRIKNLARVCQAFNIDREKMITIIDTWMYCVSWVK